MLTIRPFNYTDEDYQAAVDLEEAVFNMPPTTVEEWKHDDETWDKNYLFHRDMILRDGKIIGCAEYRQAPWAFHPQKVNCRIYVHPDHDAPDIRPTYMAHMREALRDMPLIAIESGMLEDKPEAMRFFAENGYVEVAREALSELNLTTFDPARFEAALARVRDAGIAIATLRDLQARDENWQRKLYDMDVAVRSDIPTTGERNEFDLDAWCKFKLEGPKYDPDLWFIALDGDQYVGQSHASINTGDPELLETGVTGVLRSHRRKGIATALKIHVFSAAIQRGAKRIFTTNDSNNPMYQLNLALGFVPQPAWVRVEKALEPAAGEA